MEPPDKRWYGTTANLGGRKNPHGLQLGSLWYKCAALARALGTATRRQTAPERVTIFTDAQAAIRRMASEEPGPGQMYAPQARKHIATPRKARPSITIEIQWRPAHKGDAGNENAVERAKLAVEELDAHRVERLG